MASLVQIRCVKQCTAWKPEEHCYLQFFLQKNAYLFRLASSHFQTAILTI